MMDIPNHPIIFNDEDNQTKSLMVKINKFLSFFFSSGVLFYCISMCIFRILRSEYQTKKRIKEEKKIVAYSLSLVQTSVDVMKDQTHNRVCRQLVYYCVNSSAKDHIHYSL
jgi:hypothetical protein